MTWKLRDWYQHFIDASHFSEYERKRDCKKVGHSYVDAFCVIVALLEVISMTLSSNLFIYLLFVCLFVCLFY